MIRSLRASPARWAVAAAAAALASTGCIGPDLRDCSIVCAGGQGCPSGLTCGAEGMCRTSLDAPCSALDPDADAGTSADIDAAAVPAESCNGKDDDADGRTDEGPAGELIACDSGCDAALFDTGSFEEEFDDPTGFPSRWGTGFVAPTLSAGALVYGPYAATPNWWQKFGSAGTLQTFGDVLVCARIRIAPGAPRENNLDMFVRGSGETSILVSVGLSTAQAVSIGYRDQIVTWLAGQPIPVAGEALQSFTVMVHAQGDRFHAEVRNDAADGVVTVRATSADAAATGSVGFIGWDLPQAATVERLVAGTPSARAAAILTAADERSRPVE